MKTVTCYRPVGEAELKLVADSGYTNWPPRLPEQPIFYPVTNLEYAIRLTQWNVSDLEKDMSLNLKLNQSIWKSFQSNALETKNV
ncbi:hypothetical protein ORJ04_08905 [Rheinheimera baltica]|uniref:Uncharacterized protein n=1 Tax=Rheinheimera baltica TaxID=67576 RepID=A0ABT9HY65_9GAMM|nr:hypothetical protein [Rheinheimera baltica]MDP5136064.1 hypothetical protein [Rheinheimera baltica]